MLFIHISSSNFPEMRHLGTFWSILSNGCHGKGDHYKSCSFDVPYIIASSMTVQNFGYHQITGKKAVASKNSQGFSF